MDTVTATVQAITSYVPLTFPGPNGQVTQPLNPAPIAVVVLSVPNLTQYNQNNQTVFQTTSMVQVPIYSSSDLATYVPGSTVTLSVQAA